VYLDSLDAEHMSDNVKVTLRRNFSAHHMLTSAARVAIADAERKDPGWFLSELTAITMCALSIEALCNSLGEHIVRDWKDFESASPIAKLRLLCGKLGIPYVKDKEPWASLKWLHRFRNAIAHAKPEILKEEYVWTRQEYDTRPMDRPKSRLEKEITLGNAKRALRTAEEIKTILCDAIPAETRFGLYDDGWHRTAHAINDDA
jgi:hypothetical protein